MKSSVKGESWDDFSGVHLWDKPEDLSDCEPDARALVCVVLDVTGVLVSLFLRGSRSVVRFSRAVLVGKMFYRSLFLSPKKRVWPATQEGMRYEDSPVKAPLPSSRRVTPSTPLLTSHVSFVGEQGCSEVGEQMWRAREEAPWRPKFLLRQMKDSGQWDRKSNG